MDCLIEHFRDKARRKELFKEFKEIEMLYAIISPDAFMRPFMDDCHLGLDLRCGTKGIHQTVYVDRAFQKKLNVDARSITLRPMRTKWAYCSTSGRLTFDASLPNLPSELQDYVIVHELLHFQVPNHGKLWKNLMRVHLEDYEALASKLSRIDS